MASQSATRAAAVVSVVASALWLTACSRPEPPPAPVRAVKLMTVGLSPLTGEAEFSAEVRARVETRLGFRVAGKLAQRPVELGQRVSAGQLLAVLDAQDFQLSVQAAQAAVASALTQRDLALADARRFRELREQNFISGAELDRRESTLRAAQAQLDQAQAQLAAQNNQAAYTRLLAPGAGVVTAVDAEPGQVLTTGATVIRLALDGPRDAVMSVPEDQVRRLPIGGSAQVVSWADGRSFTGTVREIGAAADPLTRTFTVKVGLPREADLLLGTTVYVSPQSLSRVGMAAMSLPTSALRQDQGRNAVWKLDPASMTVQSVPVEVVAADGNRAVVQSGLRPGDEVVVAGVHVLNPGEKVMRYQPATPPAPAASR